MPQFAPGIIKVSVAPITVKPAGLSCAAALYLVSDGAKVATSVVPFTSTGAQQSIRLPITMPSAEGIYPVYLDINAEGVPFAAFVATEDVTVAAAPPEELPQFGAKLLNIIIPNRMEYGKSWPVALDIALGPTDATTTVTIGLRDVTVVTPPDDKKVRASTYRYPYIHRWQVELIPYTRTIHFEAMAVAVYSETGIGYIPLPPGEYEVFVLTNCAGMKNEFDIGRTLEVYAAEPIWVRPTALKSHAGVPWQNLDNALDIDPDTYAECVLPGWDKKGYAPISWLLVVPGVVGGIRAIRTTISGTLIIYAAYAGDAYAESRGTLPGYTWEFYFPEPVKGFYLMFQNATDKEMERKLYNVECLRWV